MFAFAALGHLVIFSQGEGTDRLARDGPPLPLLEAVDSKHAGRDGKGGLARDGPPPPILEAVDSENSKPGDDRLGMERTAAESSEQEVNSGALTGTTRKAPVRGWTELCPCRRRRLPISTIAAPARARTRSSTLRRTWSTRA